MDTNQESSGRTQTTQSAANRRYLVTALSIPVVAAGIGLATVAGVWSSLPEVVASHWGPGGVNATQGRVAFTVTATVVVLGIGLLLAAAGWFTPADGRRTVLTLVGATTGFLGVVLYGALVGQRGVTDATQAELPGLLFVAGIVAAVVIGAGARALAPRPTPPPADRPTLPAAAPTVPLADGERVAWFGHTASARWIDWVCVALVALACLCAVIASPWAAIGPVLGIALVLLLARARVTVDSGGLRVTSMGFLTWLSVPIDTVAYAERSSLTAFKEFGGLGMRYRKDARAFVTRTGEALLVVGQDGTRTYVSMDDSASAAAVLNTLSRRSVRR